MTAGAVLQVGTISPSFGWMARCCGSCPSVAGGETCHSHDQSASAWQRRLAGIILLTGLVGAAPVRACTLPTDAVTVQASRLSLDGRSFTVATQTLADLNSSRSRLVVLDARCHTAWSAVVNGILSHFDVRVLGGTRVLQFVTMQVSGDGTGYTHRLMVMRGGRLRPALPPVTHTGKDGFYLGKLLDSRSEGIVTWTADPRGESEADAHPFVVRRWIWSDGTLVPDKTYKTSRKYAAPDNAMSRPDYVAKAISLPFRDQTGDDRSRFQDYDSIENRMQNLAMKQAEGR